MPRVPPSEWGRLFNFAGGGLIHLELYPETMADAAKILGQTQPAAATWTDLYTVPSATSVQRAALYACNAGASLDTIGVRLAQAGAANDISQAIYNDAPINPADTFLVTGAIFLAATDVVRVYSTTGDTVFTLVGIETT